MSKPDLRRSSALITLSIFSDSDAKARPVRITMKDVMTVAVMDIKWRFNHRKVLM